MSEWFIHDEFDAGDELVRYPGEHSMTTYPNVSDEMVDKAVREYERLRNGALFSAHDAMRAALEAALAAQPAGAIPEARGESLDHVLAEIEAMGWRPSRTFGWRISCDAAPGNPKYQRGGYMCPSSEGDTPLAAAIALREKLRIRAAAGQPTAGVRGEGK